MQQKNSHEDDAIESHVSGFTPITVPSVLPNIAQIQ